MTTFLNARFTRPVAVWVIACLAWLHVPVAAFASDEAPAEELKHIQYEYYFRGKYSDAVDALQSFLERKDLPRDVEVSAREYLAASYVLSGRTDKGKDQFLYLLNADVGYKGPDPSTFKVEVVEAFESTRDTFLAVKLRTAPDRGGSDIASNAAAGEQSTPVYKKWWFYVGLAAAFVLVAAAAAPQEEDGPADPPAPTGTVTVGVLVQ